MGKAIRPSEAYRSFLLKEYHNYVLANSVLDDIYTYQSWLEWRMELKEAEANELKEQLEDLGERYKENVTGAFSRNQILLRERELLQNEIAEKDKIIAAKTSIIQKQTINLMALKGEE